MTGASAVPSLDLDAAVAFLRDRLPGTPEAVAVLGSGLGGLADVVEDPEEISFRDVPGFPGAGVAGHAGCYVFGRMSGRQVLLQAGRFHVYEGHPLDVVTAPVRIAHRLGADVLLLTNAAGGIRRSLEPGSVLLLDDHMNLMWRSPLAGAVREGEVRFPDMSEPYDLELQALARRVAREMGIRLERGTYAAVAGPSYETPAEVRMLARMGADVVGMSTVPEVITARALGLRVVAFSLVTNRAAGRSLAPLSHDEVLEVGRAAGLVLQRLVQGVIAALPRPARP